MLANKLIEYLNDLSPWYYDRKSKYTIFVGDSSLLGTYTNETLLPVNCSCNLWSVYGAECFSRHHVNDYRVLNLKDT